MDWAGSDYRYNELNQLVKRVDSGIYTCTFEYDATGRQARGMNKYGETSEYLYNGLGSICSERLVEIMKSFGDRYFSTSYELIPNPFD